ncbi:MAG: primosomal protein N' [Acidobacteria bacterium]|nr:primosomal protein N' [Acidobacteriota bacterium]
MRSSPQTDRVIAVAVPVPGLGLLSYRVPEDAAMPVKGARVEVPIGGRRVVGCVVDAAAAPPAEAALRDVRAVLDAGAFLPESIVDLALWVGEYYASGPGDALAVAMPPAARREGGRAFRTASIVTLHGDADGPLAGARQRQAIDILRQQPAGLSLAALARAGVTSATIRTLVRRGLASVRSEVVERDPFQAASAEDDGPWAIRADVDSNRRLTEEQAGALAELTAAADRRAFHVSVLHGVTGSGKTEIYVRLAAHLLAGGRRVLVLVPEIALTPALAGLFRTRFGPRVAIQHSGLSSGERHDQWHRIRRGDVDIVVGTRSAVFAPLDRLGAIVVDEEHEGSYKQDEVPRYHARDVAVVRARMERTLVVLGSATPSLESMANVRAGRYAIVRLTRRVLDRPLAAVRVVDMRREVARQGTMVTFSQALLDGLAARLARREQSLVLLNRRGFATVIFCRQCGASLECPHCSVNLTYHRAARRARCHYCNYGAAVPTNCGQCGGEFLEHSGFGTERLHADLQAQFPGTRIVRVDRDTIRRRGAVARVLRSVALGEVDILIGTQMIAKGHDFPAVTLVGVVSADVGLGLADFRASERTFQLLTQVVGRAGRGEIAGEAIVQTLYPEHYSVVAAAHQDYAAFLERELEFRRALEYPPAVSLINVVVKGRTLDAAMRDAADVANRTRQAGARVLGPAPAPVSKVKDEYRVQFFVKGTHRAAMRRAVQTALDARADLRRRVVVDVDPVSVL